MRNRFIALTAFCLLFSLTAHAQEPSKTDSQSFKLHLTPAVETNELSIRYHMTGAFGGYGGFLKTQAGVRDYVIDTSYQDKPAESLKVIIYCPGYQVETLDFPSLDAIRERKAELHLKPLGTVSFHGRILLPEGLKSDEVKISVGHYDFWACYVFGMIDCMLTNFNITSVDVTEDGRFEAQLPDFAHDPIVSSFSEPGDFIFEAVDRKSGSLRFRLKPEGDAAKRFGIPIADTYPGEQQFIPEVEN